MLDKTFSWNEDKMASIFFKFDDKSSFYQILIDEADKEKTAFITHDGLYQFNILPIRAHKTLSQQFKTFFILLRPYFTWSSHQTFH